MRLLIRFTGVQNRSNVHINFSTIALESRLVGGKGNTLHIGFRRLTPSQLLRLQQCYHYLGTLVELRQAGCAHQRWADQGRNVIKNAPLRYESRNAVVEPDSRGYGEEKPQHNRPRLESRLRFLSAYRTFTRNFVWGDKPYFTNVNPPYCHSRLEIEPATVVVVLQRCRP